MWEILAISWPIIAAIGGFGLLAYDERRAKRAMQAYPRTHLSVNGSCPCGISHYGKVSA